MSGAPGKPKLIAIVGPTASGKSALAVALAKKIGNAEIVSADSRQVYKGLDIASGKITKREMKGVLHHLLDVASLRRTFTAADYQKAARRAIAEILLRGNVPILCGGTGFYINAAIHNIRLPDVPPQKEIRMRLEKLSTEQLFTRLSRKDPRRARTIDRHNRRRLIRALEIIESTGAPVPEFATKSEYDVLMLGIPVPDPVLRKKISTRLSKRIRAGMVAEVKKLHEKGVNWKRMEDLGLECRYVSRYLRGLLSKKEMEEALRNEIWHYAKRQMTWFKKDKDICWISGEREVIRVAGKFLNR